jgi:hypothetical protein
VADDWEFWVVSEGDDQFMDHQTKDTELGGTAVVQFNSTLLQLGFLIESVPAEVDVSVAEVTNEFVASIGDRLHEGAFKDTNEGDDLHNTGGGDRVGAEDSGNTVGVRAEGMAGVVNVAWKVDSGTGGDLTKEGKHADTSMLDFDVSEAVEAFLGFTAQLAEGIEEAKGSLGTEFVLEGHLEGGLGCGGGSRGKGGGAGEKGGDNGKFHHLGN